MSAPSYERSGLRLVEEAGALFVVRDRDHEQVIVAEATRVRPWRWRVLRYRPTRVRIVRRRRSAERALWRLAGGAKR